MTYCAVSINKLGMEPWKAYRNGNTGKGYRAVARSGILTHTITDKRLAQAGYFVILDKYESLRDRLNRRVPNGTHGGVGGRSLN